MISARTALTSIRLSERELGELGRIENAVSDVLSKFDGIPIRATVYLTEAAAPPNAIYIDPAVLQSADRIICLLKYRFQRDTWTVDILPERDAYGQLAGYTLVFEPSAAACQPEVALAKAETKKSKGESVLASLYDELSSFKNSGAVCALPTDFTLPKNPTLSVILGTYNRIEHFKKVVASIRSASFGTTYEICAVDGGSDDGTREWASAQKDIILVGERKLEGAVIAFNQAFALAKGKFIANLNDDAIVEDRALADGVKYLEEHPKAGQIAFGFRGDGEEWHVNDIYPKTDHPEISHPTTYANFGIVRREVANQIAYIQGNSFWNPIYKTYAADCEFSAWVWRLGMRVDRLPHLHVTDTRAADALRERNSKDSGMEAKRMYARWPAEAFKPDGPDPRVSPAELERYRQVKAGLLSAKAPEPADLLTQVVEMVGWPGTSEERRLRKIAPLIRALDPVDGQFPKRAGKMTAERVLHISLCTRTDPQAGQVRALKALGSGGYEEVRWMDFPAGEARREAIFKAAQKIRPTLTFMQLQTANAIDLETIRGLREISPEGIIASWCGDVASENAPQNTEWQMPLGRAIDLVLHSSMSHVRALRSAGLHHSAYLQIGLDTEQYCLPPDGTLITALPGETYTYDVCFLGSRYGGDSDVFSKSMRRHDSALRDEVVTKMREAFGDRFGLFGRGWGGEDKIVTLDKAHETYWKSRISLNVSLDNGLFAYSSDRLLRILGCGCLLLTKRFPGMGVFGLDETNCLTWDTADEAVSLAKDILTQPDRLSEIAKAGAELAHSHHSWDVRMLELIPYLEAVRSAR